jgi:hypothetical protein
MLRFIPLSEITQAFEDDGPNIIIKSNGPLGRGMGEYNENCRMTTKCVPKRQDLKKINRK